MIIKFNKSQLLMKSPWLIIKELKVHNIKNKKIMIIKLSIIIIIIINRRSQNFKFGKNN